MAQEQTIFSELRQRFPEVAFMEQPACDDVPTAWVDREHIRDVLAWLKRDARPNYPMLFDLTAIDERAKRVAADQPQSDFTLVYYLLSIGRNSDIRLKVPLQGEFPSGPTVTDIYPNANWYEREVWDMFGIEIEGHPFLKRILLPPDWIGHPLRKEYPARATDLEPYELPETKANVEEEDVLKFTPEELGLARSEGGKDYLFLNLGPHHPGTHGLLRIILQLDGERINNAVMDIGWHHRAAEKMAERQTYHTYIPYTDRIDYLAGTLNELPYLLSIEKLAGIEVPPRAQVIRVMVNELYRIQNHLVFFGTFAADLGALSPVFFTFNDRERIFSIVEAICGYRMHPEWFRIGGVREDLPDGWDVLVRDFVDYFPKRIDEYCRMMVKNSIFRKRTKGVGVYTTESALEWGVTGPNLRATGLPWDLRKIRPYSSYDQFEFEIPTETEGDSYARCQVRMEEMRQSLRIVEQCLNNMPEGLYKADHPLTMPPRKEQTMVAIETLIDHFLSVSWGQPMPQGETMVLAEGAKGNYGYYVISDTSPWAYRCHIRTSSYPHLQTIPWLCKGLLVSDLIAILGSIDYVLADVDR